MFFMQIKSISETPGNKFRKKNQCKNITMIENRYNFVFLNVLLTLFYICHCILNRSFYIFWISWSHSASMSVESRNPREACCSKLKVSLFFFSLPFCLITMCTGAVFGPSYLNPCLTMTVLCCKNVIFPNSIPLLWHLYPHTIGLPWLAHLKKL